MFSHVQKDQAKDPDEEVGIVFADISSPFAQLTLISVTRPQLKKKNEPWRCCLGPNSLRFICDWYQYQSESL